MAVIEEKMGLAVSGPAALPLAGVSARRLGLWLAMAGWVALGLMWATGSAGVFGHDQGGLPAPLAIGMFLIGWTVMVSAMMLPSSLPTLARFDQGLVAESDGGAPRFVAGYLLTWAAFGAVAFAGDGMLHLSVARISWLAERSSLIVGGAAVLAGVAELLGRAAPPRFPSVPAGAGSFSIGKAHAADRIRRCWPLMLFAMAVGMSSPAWMVGLTMIMGLELWPRSSMPLRLVGLVVLALGVAVIIEPGWAPRIFGTV